jgi:hypothetical protein
MRMRMQLGASLFKTEGFTFAHRCARGPTWSALTRRRRACRMRTEMGPRG